VREVLRRVIEAGYERLADGPESVRHRVAEMKLPKETLSAVLGALDDTKNGLYRVVAREVRDFLEHSNLSDELIRALTAISFEIKTEVRFIPSDARPGRPVPDVKARVNVKRSSTPAPESGPARAPAQDRASQPPEPSGDSEVPPGDITQ
jgi:hypothetical protein